MNKILKKRSTGEIEMTKKGQPVGQIKKKSYVNQFVFITFFKIMQNRCFIQIGQIRHIFAFFVFRWIYLLK